MTQAALSTQIFASIRTSPMYFQVERERKRESVGECVSGCGCVCARAFTCVSLCVRACVRACVREHTAHARRLMSHAHIPTQGQDRQMPHEEKPGFIGLEITPFAPHRVGKVTHQRAFICCCQHGAGARRCGVARVLSLTSCGCELVCRLMT